MKKYQCYGVVRDGCLEVVEFKGTTSQENGREVFHTSIGEGEEINSWSDDFSATPREARDRWITEKIEELAAL